MPPPARTPPQGAAARVTGAALDLASDLTEGFRKSNRWARLRGAVLGTWLLLALVTFWVACPSSIGGPGNRLDAVVQFVPDSIMGSQVLVHNDSSRHWTDVVFTLDDGWRLEQKTVRAGDKQVLAVARFRRDAAEAPADLRPRTLTIECEQGKAVIPLGPRKP